MDFKLAVAALAEKPTGLKAEEIAALLEIPPEEDMGDYALPCFKMAKIMRKAPGVIAQELAQAMEKPEFISEIKSAGGYLNFFLNRGYYTKDVVKAALAAGDGYGGGDIGAGKTVCIDYSSINIAKPFHIGHLLTTVIGHSLYRIYSFLGYRCVGINHLGDWGTQFGKLIAAYKHWGEGAAGNLTMNDMLTLYVRFHEEAESNEALNDEAREWFKKIEDGDAEALNIFNIFKETTLKEVNRVYDILDIQFDSYAGESFYNDKMQPVIDELKEKNLLEFSEGAYVVQLGEDIPPCIILKSDGATLYSTRDLAAAFYRKQTYDFDKCLYVVAYQQSLHFKQCFRVVEKMGYPWHKDLIHVAFGMVSLEDGTLSTRKGKVVFLEDVLQKAVEKTLSIINEKNPDIINKEETAKSIGVGAVVFQALSNNRIKDMVFSWDRALNFDGETGPYAQYTHVRCASVQKRAGNAYDGIAPDFSALDNREAFQTARQLCAFPDVVREAAEKNEPSLLTRFVIDLAQAFNKYYFEHRIIDEDKNATTARLMLTAAVKSVLKTGLYLIGVQPVEQM
jgi:arginyl-tRNA synthetase